MTRIKSGDQGALAELMPLVYQLRHLATHFMREKRVGHTLQPTALVHEAYLYIVGQDRANWQNRPQFMAIAARIMRRILLQYTRRRAAGKRVAREPGEANPLAGAALREEIIAVDEALSRLNDLSRGRPESPRCAISVACPWREPPRHLKFRRGR